MRKQALIGGLILLVAALIAAFLVWSRSEPPEKPQEDQVPLVQAEALDIRSGNLQVNGAGTVRAREELTLAAEVAGKLVYVNPNLREGQRIAKGAVLFRIDTSDYRNAIQTAQADVALQNVAVLEASEEVALAKAELARFERRGAAEDALASVDESDYAARILPPRALAGPESDSAAETDGGESKPETTSGLATRDPQLQSARAALARAEAQLANARTSLGRTVVRAPFTGVVRAEQISIGSYVQPGQALGTVVGTAEYEAVIPLSETEAALIPGLFGGSGGRIEAAVYSDYGGMRYRWFAYVDRVNSLLNPQTRTIDVYLRIPNPLRGGALAAVQDDDASAAPISAAPPLFVGSFVSAEITGRALDEYAVLPLAALRAGNKVWLVREGKLRIVPVQIYQRTDETALINTAGLGENPMVITGSLSAATEGQQVRVTAPRSVKPAPTQDTVDAEAQPAQ